jgi:hypothetical protein
VIYLQSVYPVAVDGIQKYVYGLELLYQGVSLRRVYRFYSESEKDIKNWIASLQPFARYAVLGFYSRRVFMDRYELLDQIGKGKFACVYRCVSKGRKTCRLTRQRTRYMR